MKFWLAEHADIIFYGLFVALILGEVVLRFILKVAKENKALEWVDSAFIAIILATVIRFFLIQTFIIPSSSMENTLLIGDQLIVNKFVYGLKVPFSNKFMVKFKDPERGEIIVFNAVDKKNMKLIKRCIGLPGDVVEMRDKVLYINGEKQNEHYVIYRDPQVLPRPYPRDNFGPIKVPEDQYLMLGDNRDRSADSRYWGLLPHKMIEGRAWVVYWPMKRWKKIKSH